MARSRLELVDECLLLGEHRLLARVLRFALRGEDGALLVVKVVVAGEGRQIATVDVDDLRHEAVHELAIVRRHDERAVEVPKEAFEPDDGFDVEVVRRLVEQQRVRAHQENARERDAHLPTAGQLADVAVDDVRAKTEAGENFSRARFESVAAEFFEPRLSVPESFDELIEFVRALRIGEGLFERS